MVAIRPGRRASWRERADRRSDMLRGAALAVVLVGMVASALIAQGWRRTMTSQRDERVERQADTRKVTIASALANYEYALQAARSLWLASDAVNRPEFNALFVPVYRAELGRNASVAERRRQFVGWAAGQFRAGDFLHAALQTTTPTTGVELHDERVGSLYREVGRLARTDSLTGVANRRAWDEELPRELARAARSGEELCLALVDLDHFKAYNDRHGHTAGDRLLTAAAAWRERLPKTDLLARYGGEEFAVLLPNCGLGNALEIAERLRTAQPEGTCSIGVATWDRREEASALVDRALYAAKKGGRNRSCVDLAETAEAAGRAQG
jgi:diguanylate cyclase (GGDEF)-like protein